jgi:hypothetical protein
LSFPRDKLSVSVDALAAFVDGPDVADRLDAVPRVATEDDEVAEGAGGQRPVVVGDGRAS